MSRVIGFEQYINQTAVAGKNGVLQILQLLRGKKAAKASYVLQYCMLPLKKDFDPSLVQAALLI